MEGLQCKRLKLDHEETPLARRMRQNIRFLADDALKGEAIGDRLDALIGDRLAAFFGSKSIHLQWGRAEFQEAHHKPLMIWPLWSRPVH